MSQQTADNKRYENKREGIEVDGMYVASYGGVLRKEKKEGDYASHYALYSQQ